jgi:hypothetical protein
MNRITKAFLLVLESFTNTDEVKKQIKPVSCCVCDSISTKAQWSTVVDIHKFRTLCDRAKLRKSNSSKIYGDQLRNQYTAKDNRLKDFILSPETYVNIIDKVLVCKECLSELQTNSKVRHVDRRGPPTQFIIRGYMIGDAPDVLSNLNQVELF